MNRKNPVGESKWRRLIKTFVATPLLALAFVHASDAANIVWDNLGTLPSEFFSFHSSDARGNEVVLAEGPRQLVELAVDLTVDQDELIDLRVRFYANDGPDGIPQTLIHQSNLDNVDLIGDPAANMLKTIVMPIDSSITFPDRFTWVLYSPSGAPGSAFGGPPVIGEHKGGWSIFSPEFMLNPFEPLDYEPFRSQIVALTDLHSAADFNEDGFVNAEDLSVWRQYYGLSDPFGHDIHEFGDADSDADIDGADFLTWQRQFGSGVTSIAAPQTVPESPAVALLSGLAIVGVLSRCRRSVL